MNLDNGPMAAPPLKLRHYQALVKHMYAQNGAIFSPVLTQVDAPGSRQFRCNRANTSPKLRATTLLLNWKQVGARSVTHFQLIRNVDVCLTDDFFPFV